VFGFFIGYTMPKINKEKLNQLAKEKGFNVSVDTPKKEVTFKREKPKPEVKDSPELKRMNDLISQNNQILEKISDSSQQKPIVERRRKSWVCTVRRNEDGFIESFRIKEDDQDDLSGLTLN